MCPVSYWDGVWHLQGSCVYRSIISSTNLCLSCYAAECGGQGMLGVEETLEIWVMLNRRKLGGLMENRALATFAVSLGGQLKYLSNLFQSFSCLLPKAS